MSKTSPKTAVTIPNPKIAGFAKPEHAQARKAIAAIAMSAKAMMSRIKHKQLEQLDGVGGCGVVVDVVVVVVGGGVVVVVDVVVVGGGVVVDVVGLGVVVDVVVVVVGKTSSPSNSRASNPSTGLL